MYSRTSLSTWAISLCAFLLLSLTPAAAGDSPYTGRWWRTVTPGIEEAWYFPPDSGGAALLVLRIDPAQFTFRVHYQPGGAHSLTAWQDALPEAVGFINAGFFTHDRRARGLLIADGVQHTPPMHGRGGIFSVQDGESRVRSAVREPYSGEALEHAVQGFPMLVLDGAAVQIETQTDTRTRRTVIAQDRWGHILWITTPGSGVSLWDMADYLPRTDLGVRMAFNLDGGSSTLLSITPPNGDGRQIESRAGVPAVIAVYPRR